MSKIRMNFELSVNAVLVQRIRDTDDGREVLEEKSYSVDEVPVTLEDGELAAKSLAAYGLSKLLQDRTSSEPGESKLAAMDDVFAILKEGKYRVRKESTGGGKKASIDPIFAMAVAEFMSAKSGKEVTTATATIYLEGRTTDERKALKAHDEISGIMARIKEEAAEGAAALGDLFN